MSEIGSGSGSSYPTALDTDTTKEVNSPNAGKTKAKAETINDMASAIVAIETELGTDPSGTIADLKTYLQTEHGTNGTHGAVTAYSISTDTVSEKTATVGVTIDGVLLKDSQLTTDVVNEKTTDAGVTIDGLLIKDSTLPTMPFTKSYDSGEQTITSAGSLALTHGLGIAPKIIQCFLKCIDAGGELGYSQNDIAPIDYVPIENNLGRGLSVKVQSTTSITVRFGSNANAFQLINATTGDAGLITNSKWKLIVRAFA